MARPKKTEKTEREIAEMKNHAVDALEMELQNLVIEATKPVAVGHEGMKEKLISFLSEWDALRIIEAKHIEALHSSMRKRLVTAIGAGFGYTTIAQYEKERQTKLKS